MKKSLINWIVFLLVISLNPLFSFAKTSQDKIDEQALVLLQHMSLREKIGQKLMFDFRYWCEDQKDNLSCTQDLTTINPTIQKIITTHHIGGIILFSNNLKTIPQITTLIYSLQKTMYDSNNLGLLLGTDQEGGIVVRMPRDVSVSFPGNMALAAAYLGQKDKNYSAEVGKIIAADLKAVGINVDFAPDVDVNSNPLNPIINVRSFSDDPELVAKLGLELSQAIQMENVAATLKHFPGHGDTVTDSHVGLPVVNHSLQDAWKIDLYPFKKIININAPDLIMTAHIQYPALDDSQIYAGKAGNYITTPATLSRKIQYDLLRDQLGYQGVVITDALDMGAIAQNFDSADATIKAFQAGDDIALMPISITHPQNVDTVEMFIRKIEIAVLDGTISQAELDQSVLRILKLKIKLGLLKPDSTPLPEKISNAEKIIADENQHKIEKSLADDAITLVQNNNNVVPIKAIPNTRIHILTPWVEQGAGIAEEIKRLKSEGLLPSSLIVTSTNIAAADLIHEKNAIDNADIVIVGSSVTKSLPLSSQNNSLQFYFAKKDIVPVGTLVFPEIPKGDSQQRMGITQNLMSVSKSNVSDDQFIFQVLQYAKTQHKKTIFISLLAPYDMPNYATVSDVMLAGYDYYGYLVNQDPTQSYYRGPSMQALTRVIFGLSHAHAKLPINIPNPLIPEQIIYPRGTGIQN